MSKPAYFVPAFGPEDCEFCGARTFWKTFDAEEGSWIAACYTGHGCAKNSTEETIDLSIKAQENGVPLRVVMKRMHLGISHADVACASTRSIGGDLTPRAEIDGVTRPLAEWSKIYGIHYQTLRKRHLSGRTGTDLISSPKGKKAKSA